jgi:2-O-methyltransferase
MNSDFKRRLWDVIRPLHRPITSALRRRLGNNYHEHPEMELPLPYEAVQLDAERNLHQYLHVSPGKISQIVIVGAYEADEIRRMNRSYPNAKFLCFEPNPNTFQKVAEKYQHCPWVTARKLALSDAPGRNRFYELKASGNGSLLEPDAESWAKSIKQENKSVTSFEVEISTLDREAAALPTIDLLWMDVQGAEGMVLAGGRETLKRTRVVFAEVALFHSPYKGAQLFPQISATLQDNDFTCVGLGLDAWNGTGNALFIRNFESLIGK